ncbi:hypothetical protein [Proteus phage vB_PmiM_ZX7]|nr:hypothetical protein [Proteus phage vB_PmiM_ZX7]
MKTLLEWLEENRSNLEDGIYEYVTGGGVYCQGTVLAVGVINYTMDKYMVQDGNISLITPYNQVKENKYLRECKGVKIDVYDVLKAFSVTDPALQHLIKKALCTGLRGHKTQEQDLQDILDSAKRAVELNK